MRRRLLYIAHVYDAGGGVIGSKNKDKFDEISTPTSRACAVGARVCSEHLGIIAHDQEHEPERTTFGYFEDIMIERGIPEHNKNEHQN